MLLLFAFVTYFPFSVVRMESKKPLLYNIRSSESFVVIVVSIAIFTVSLLGVYDVRICGR